MTSKFLSAILGSTALVTIAMAQTTLAQNQQAQPGQTQQQAAQQGVTASEFRNQRLYRRNGQEFGRVSNVVRDNSNQQTYAVASAGNRQLHIPTDQVTLQNGRYTLTGSIEGNNFTQYRDGMSGYTQLNGDQSLDLASADSQQGDADHSRVVVQQPAPDIRVNRAAPEISVQQPQPRVTVQQPNPEIIVRQPQPTVTVNIPQPEIIVRMPRPDVNVAMAQPQVDVRQPRPDVQVAQPEQQPQVQIQQEQPEVKVQQPQGEPNVVVQRQGQPQVRYESAEPKVVVNKPEGQPKVRYEQIEQGQSQQSGQNQQGDTQQKAAQEAERQRAYQQRFGTASNTRPSPTGQARTLTVDELNDKTIYNSRGQKLGDVDRVVFNPEDIYPAPSPRDGIHPPTGRRARPPTASLASLLARLC
jgi:sporulation protein YlmC with PRC-barrel domain